MRARFFTEIIQLFETFVPVAGQVAVILRVHAFLIGGLENESTHLDVQKEHVVFLPFHGTALPTF
jgi:hypothetical protein